MYIKEDGWRKHKESFGYSRLILSEFKQPVSAHYINNDAIVGIKVTLFFAANLNTLSLSEHETAREGRSTMDLAEAAKAEQTERNSPSVSEAN